MPDSIEATILVHWPLALPVRVAPIASGINNTSFLVEAGSGTFVLKRYLDAGVPQRVRFEHALLSALATHALPFAVPVPVRSRSGESIVVVEGGSIALFPLILGHSPEHGDVAIAGPCGRALAALDATFAQLTLEPAISVSVVFGRLATVHPDVPNVPAAVHRHFHDRDEAKQLAALLERADREWARTTSGWPHQLIHGDYFPPNVLVEEGKVSGILDFEFSGLGHRAMDFTVGLRAFSVLNRDWDAGPAWPLVDAFATGYLGTLPLTKDELDAVPDLFRMWEASKFVHWLGRLELGLASFDDISERADRLRALNRWLDARREDLVGHLNRVAGEPRRHVQEPST
jgi:homoserine kinase type II